MLTLPGSQILRPLGHGSLGTVYLAYQQREQRHVALHVLERRTGRLQPMARWLGARSVDELRHKDGLLQSTRDSHLAEYYGLLFLDDGTPPSAFVAEYLPGRSLAEMVRGGPTAAPLAARLMDQVAAGLRTLHDADFTHGKLTPDRIRLLPSTDGHDVTVRVRGGGLVSLLGVPAAEPTRTGPTWCYLAPEQLETPLPTPLTDVYALGVLLYQLLTGRLPYVATSAQELTAAWRRPLAHLPKDAGAGPIPPALIELVAHCLMLQPEQRPLGVELVRAELRLALDVPPSRPPKSSKVDDVVAPPAAPAAPFERGSPPAVAPAAPFPQVAAIPKTEVHALSLEPLRRARQEHDAKPSLTSLLALCDTVNPPSPSVAGSRSLYAHGSGGVPAQTRTALAVTVAAVLFGTVFALLARLMTLRG